MTTETNSIFSAASLNLAAGQKIAGCYLLERPLDTGGGHLIWIAQDEVLGKQVSLHFLPEVVAEDTVAIDELRHEVKRNRPLIHPGVLRVYDLVEGGEVTAVAMESFEARCLAAILAEKGHFEVDDLEPWLDQICVTLEEAHRIKLTHRDLAPQNVFVTSERRVLLANFGISRVVQGSLERAGGAGRGLGRIHTLSPQLIGGAAPAVTDDVYGVGALFHELLSGQPIFSGGDVADKIRRVNPLRLSDIRDEATDRGKVIPPGWENVIAACLNKNSSDRPHRPAEIVSSIEAYAPAIEPVSVAAVEPIGPISDDTLAEIEPVRAHLVQEIHESPVIEAPAEMPEPEPLHRLDSGEKADVEPVLEIVAESTVERAAETMSESLAGPVSNPIAESVVEPIAELASVPDPSMEPVLETPPQPTSVEHETVRSTVSTANQERPADSEAKPSTPRSPAYYDTDEDAFSAFLPRRFRFPLAVAAAVVLLLLLINGFLKGSKDSPKPPRSIATTESGERSELTSVKNSLPESISEPARISSKPAATPVPDAPPEPGAIRKSPPSPELLLAVGPSPAAGGVSSGTGAAPSLDKQIVEKAAALDRLKQDLAATEKAQEALLKDQRTAAANLAAAQKSIEERTKSAGTAKKAADELLAARKKREDDQQAAETAAKAAQQLAAEKVRAAEDARKALADFEAQNREKLAAQNKMDSEIKALQEAFSGHQQKADDSAKAAAAAEAARQQQVAAIAQTEREIGEAKAQIAKASVDGERQRQAMESERRKLDDEIASMKALFEQKMKDIEDRRRQIEGSTATPVAPADTTSKPIQAAQPAPTLPLMALKTEVPAATPVPERIPVPPTVESGSTNSLGIRFAPVGDVLFSIWQTRVKDFEMFAKAVNLRSTAWRGPGFRQSPDHPVVNVTWTEAIAFCKWLTDKEHKEGALPANQFYRLPYDLEWSKAVGLPDESGKTPEARDMGVPDVYPWGTEWPPTKGAGNYTGEETGSDVAIKGYDDGFAWTAPVGTFPPNKFGLYDMGGNVWQWCMDSWNNESKAKVLRGASWYNGALKLSLLSSCRVHAAPDSSTDNYGFRIVRATETVSGKPGKK